MVCLQQEVEKQKCLPIVLNVALLLLKKQYLTSGMNTKS